MKKFIYHYHHGLLQILSYCTLGFSHNMGFYDSVSCKSVSYKICICVINEFPRVPEIPLNILESSFQNQIVLIISFCGKLFILLNYFMLKCKLCVLVADRLLARVKVGDISRSPEEPP